MSDAWDGRPQNPEVKRRHWLQSSVRLEPVLFWWVPSRNAWRPAENGWEDEYSTAAEMSAWRYLGPCLTPAEVLAREAAAAREMLATLRAAVEKIDDSEDSEPHTIDLVLAAITRMEPAPDALARMLAEAEARGRDAEAEAARLNAAAPKRVKPLEMIASVDDDGRIVAVFHPGQTIFADGRYRLARVRIEEIEE